MFRFSKAYNPYILIGLISTLLLLFVISYYKHIPIIEAHRYFYDHVMQGNLFVVLHPGAYWFSAALTYLSGIEPLKVLYLLGAVHVMFAYFAFIYALRVLLQKSVSLYWLAIIAFMLMFASSIGLHWLPTRVYDFNLANRTFMRLANITSVFMHPYAIMAFALLASIIAQPATLRLGRLHLSAAIFFVLACLMKPTLIVSLIPATMMYFLVRQFQFTQRMRTLMLVFAPALALMAFQFVIGFIDNPHSKEIHLQVIFLQVWKQNNVYPFMSFLLATAFPMLILFLRYTHLKAITKIAWINLLIALVPYMLFYEVPSISNSSDRDFEWSYVIAKQMLFLVSVVEWHRWYQEMRAGAAIDVNARYLVWLTGALWCLHFAFGMMKFLFTDRGLAVLLH